MKKQSDTKNYTVAWGTHQIEIKEMVEEIEDLLLTELSNLRIKKYIPLLRPPTKGDIVKTAIELYLETLRKNNETNNTPNQIIVGNTKRPTSTILKTPPRHTSHHCSKEIYSK